MRLDACAIQIDAVGIGREYSNPDGFLVMIGRFTVGQATDSDWVLIGRASLEPRVSPRVAFPADREPASRSPARAENALAPVGERVFDRPEVDEMCSGAMQGCGTYATAWAVLSPRRGLRGSPFCLGSDAVVEGAGGQWPDGDVTFSAPAAARDWSEGRDC